MGKYKPWDMRNFIASDEEYPDYERFSSFCEFVYGLRPDEWFDGMGSKDLQSIYQGFLAGVLTENDGERGLTPLWERKK